MAKLRAEMDAVLSFFGGIEGLAARRIEFELLKREVAMIKNKPLPEINVELVSDLLNT